MLGAIPHRLKGSINSDVSHSTEGVCKKLSTRHTSVVMKFQAFGTAESPIPELYTLEIMQPQVRTS